MESTDDRGADAGSSDDRESGTAPDRRPNGTSLRAADHSDPAEHPSGKNLQEHEQSRSTVNATGQASARPSPTARRTPVPLAARLLAVGLCLVLAWHFLATYTWNASPNATRQIIGNDVLTAYMIPMFGQSWSVFAPNPGSVNPDLQVRAEVSRDDTTSTTDWYSLTKRSTDAGVLHHPIPSRLYLNDFILANRYYGAFMDVSESVRDQAGKTYLSADWPQALESDLLSKLGTKTNPAIDTYVRYERAVLRLVSEAAIARWGDGVTRVQVRVLKTPVVPFDQRFQNVSPEVDYFVDGWRTPLRVDGLDTGVFDSIFGTAKTEGATGHDEPDAGSHDRGQGIR